MADEPKDHYKQAAIEDSAVRLWGGLDAQEDARKEALDAITRAHMVNRIWSFEVDGYFEIAFGNGRSAANLDGDPVHRWAFPTAVSMNYPAAKALKERLDLYIQRIEAMIAEAEQTSSDGDAASD